MALDMCGLSDITEIFPEDVHIETQADTISEKIMEEIFTAPNTGK